MSQFSLNQQFEELVKASPMEEQVLGHNNNSNTDNKMMAKDESAKSRDFFQDIMLLKEQKQQENTQIRE